MELKKNDLMLGQIVLADHYQFSTPGQLYTRRGSTGRTDLYKGRCIFAHNVSGRVYIEHQVTLSGVETAKSKLKLDAFAVEF
eukprot:5566820-Ditylum_brightwellii.AAC.1